MLTRFGVFVSGIAMMTLAGWFGWPWWAYIPGAACVFVGLVLLGAWEAEPDSSGHGARGDGTGTSGGL